jgi:hypothetical protein
VTQLLVVVQVKALCETKDMRFMYATMKWSSLDLYSDLISSSLLFESPTMVTALYCRRRRRHSLTLLVLLHWMRQLSSDSVLSGSVTRFY